MKRLVAFILAGVICTPVMANEDRIAEIEAQIAELEAELRELKGSSLSVTGDNFEMSIESAFVSDSLKQEYSDVDILPEDGNQFLVLQVSVHNLTDEEQYVDWTDFLAYSGKHSLELSDKCYSVEKYEYITGYVTADRYIDGYLIYEVPTDWAEAEISYPDSYGGDFMTVTITPADIQQ